MAKYHPPLPITSNSAPAITADLAYEGHGKCGQTVILSSTRKDTCIFEAEEWGANAWRMDVISTGYKGPNDECPCQYAGFIRKFRANNIDSDMCVRLEGVPIFQPFSIMADITVVELDASWQGTMVVLYMDCQQS